MKLPAYQFYPGDWRKDPGVQALNYHDRGVWHEMICLMHESEQRGLLILNGRPMPDEVIARLLGLDNQILTTTLTTLLTYGVASRDEETGAVMSRRMVRDEKLRQIRKECGKQGGNPNLVNQKSTTPVNQKSTPSSSSSSSKSKIMAKPSVSEISEYGLTLDPPFTKTESFIAYYESNGWKVGKNPMKDWKAAVRTWQQKDKQSAPPKLRPLYDQPTYVKNGTSKHRSLWD